MIAFIYYSLLSSRIPALMPHLVLNEWLYLFYSVCFLFVLFCFFKYLLFRGWCYVKQLPSRRTFCIFFIAFVFCLFCFVFLNIGCSEAGATWNSCRLGARSVCTMQPCTSLHGHFIQSHIGRVRACLAVTCHLHFWQNDQDLLLKREWNGYWN